MVTCIDFVVEIKTVILRTLLQIGNDIHETEIAMSSYYRFKITGNF